MADRSEEDGSGEGITVKRRTVAAFIGGAIAGSGTTVAGERLTASGSSSTEPTGAIQTQNRPYLGQQNGTVTAIYYMDFQCPFCKQFENQALPKILENYNDSDLHFVIKPIAIFGSDSKRAALAAHCGWEQLTGPDKYWQWHQKLINAYDGDENSGWANTENLVGLAEDFSGLDASQFRECHKNGSHNIRAVDDRAEGNARGMSGTPYFIFPGGNSSETRTISGAQPYSRFKTVINHYLDND